jgi:hypothetical protein
MNKQKVIHMLHEKQRKHFDLTAQGFKSPMVLTPLEVNQIIGALTQPDILKLKRQQELLSELLQIASEQT